MKRKRLLISFPDIQRMSLEEFKTYIIQLLDRYRTLGDKKFIEFYYLVLLLYDKASVSDYNYQNYLMSFGISFRWDDWGVDYKSYDRILTRDDFIEWAKNNLVGKLITIKRK
jgi:hypothetical protein